MTPDEVLDFWLDEVGPAGWYAPDADLDARVRERFLEAAKAAQARALEGWRVAARPCLALIVLLDQFPRNMYRDDARAFAADARALAVAKQAIGRGHDREIAPPARQFFYLPLMHSEAGSDQARSVRLFALQDDPGDNLDHARAHRGVIRRFGRFPYRNDALGRVSTGAERDWMAAGGYASMLTKLTA